MTSTRMNSFGRTTDGVTCITCDGNFEVTAHNFKDKFLNLTHTIYNNAIKQNHVENVLKFKTYLIATFDPSITICRRNPLSELVERFEAVSYSFFKLPELSSKNLLSRIELDAFINS